MKKFLLFTAGMLTAGAAMANWGTTKEEPTAIFPANTNSYATEIKAAPDGSIWALIYHPNLKNASGETDIEHVVYEYRLQHFDKDGNPQFDKDGLLLSDYSNISYTVVNQYLHIDTQGNAIISVTDCRNSPSEGHSYTAYKVSPTGENLWGDEGVAISDALHPAPFAAFMSMVELDDHSVVFAWIEQYEKGNTIKMQRISADGKPQWGTGKELIPGEITTNPYLVNSGDNTCILVFARTSSAVLYARKIDFDGESVWGNDVRIYRGGWGSVPMHTQMNVTSSGDGGVLVAWTDDRKGENRETPYLSYITSDGKLSFSGMSDEADSRLFFDNDWRSFNVTAVPAADGSCFYATWRITSNGQSQQGVKMQKISKSGELLWGDMAKDVFPTQEITLGYLSTQPTSDGGFCSFFEKYFAFDNQQCFAARVNKDGEFVWDGGIIPISVEGIKSAGLETQKYGENSWLCNWKQTTREGDDENLTYVMTVLNENGTFGNGSVGIQSITDSALPTLSGFVRIYNIAGVEVASCTLGNGSSMPELPAGVYVARAADGSSMKFIAK